MARREAVIVGVADIPLKDGVSAVPLSPLQMQARAAKHALAEAKIPMSQVDGLFTAGMWGIGGAGQLAAVTLSEYLGLMPRYADSTNIGGCAFVSFVGHAQAAIERGLCDVALITYGSAQKSERSRNLGGRPPTLTMQYEAPWGLPTPIGGYAMAAMRHMHEFGTKPEQLAEIAVAARQWATLNPGATMREPLSIEGVLSSPMISDPLHLLDACLVTDGGGAVVMTTLDHALALGVKPVHIRGFGESCSNWTVAAAPDIARLIPAEVSSRQAMQQAGITHADVDVTEVYDSFTITTLLTLEALGFCKRGEGGDFVSNRRTAPGGAFPLNTSGGGLSYCHPGMFGIFLLIEAVRQLRGECGERQVRDAKVALVHGTGGTLSSGATAVLTRG